ncbi:dihydrofolate reductase family protein [Actinomadura sp. HBU206391]|uniref:dihydrofolate reductase family protein n=1 Tax=Actinomadura sp. HBU206391 TaxID=2731692 RepID=UPI0016500B76|nr:dihydrofolate reductase family protein [Actinomadura sp. HBU206391]MBC6457184.1 dihydrofolate reductase [Actinomadura sp. HBU206391]
MRKLFSFMMVSLDGYHAGPNEEIDWHNVDEKFGEFAAQQLDEVDTLVFGRATYEVMASYWPTPEAKRDDPVIAAMMNEASKIVVSSTLERAEWNNTRLITGDIAAELTELKARPGKDIAIFGSSALTASLLDLGLVDELRVIVAPVLLGAGRSLFRDTAGRIALTLTDTRRFDSGNVLLYYRPAETGSASRS